MSNTSETLLHTSRFRVVRVEQPTSDGGTRAREVIQHPGAVVVLPLVDADHVCLIRNYRVSVEETLIELPAGTLEAGEDPATCAARELSEETGFRAGRISSLSEFYVSPGILNERMYLFVATELTAGAAAREPGEEIENWIVSWPEALELVHSGEIQDAKTIIGILLYDRMRQPTG